MTQQTQFQHKPGYGSIFSNKDAKQEAGEAGEKWPDVQGQGCCPHCKKPFDLAAWWKKAKNKGAQYLSLSIRPPRENTQDGENNPPF